MQINYLPSVLQEIDEYKALTGTLDYTNGELENNVADLKDNQYILDATESGITHYENMLHITPLDSDTLDDRRFRVFTRYNQQLPYTERSLRNLMNTLVGANGYTLEIDHLRHSVIVRVELSAKSMLKSVNALLEHYVPLNFTIDLELLYNPHYRLEKYTYSQLEQFTHEQLREDDIS